MHLTTDPLDGLVENASRLPSPAVPDAVLAFQRLRLLDHLACLAAGFDAEGVAPALALAKRYSGRAEASVLGSRLRLAAGQAAFVNAVRARALDFCDVISPGWHPSSSDVPVALAMAELTGATGLEMLVALAVGQDLGQRINLAAQANGFFYRGFDSNVLGLFSATTIAARLLKLPRETFAAALGLAFDYGIGTFQHYQDKALAVRIGQGLVARHAIEAALLAQAGISGPRRVLAGENGFFALYAPGAADTHLLRAGLGERFLGQEVTCFKAYPHCSILLALSDTLIAARATLCGLDLERCQIRLEVSPSMRMVCGGPYVPSATAQIDAQFSARYVAANALLRGRATPAEFSAEAAREYALVTLAQRIELIETSEFQRFDHCRLTLLPAGAASISLEASHGRGWPENPLNAHDLRSKFQLCCRQSSSPAFRRSAEGIAAQVDRLAESVSLRDLLGAVNPPA
ncbi:MmgE/PrpD family protein [Pseudomonas aeruginosa]|uniref:MmgE/PrpD family protein n=1 Tax=Pseudomonas aeruginosa TaxID=287 RepID=UPI003CC50878